MPADNVLRLEDFKDRRTQRVQLQAALCQAEPGRRAILPHLVDLTYVTGADRAAVVWVDEHVPGLVHPHAVLDLASDRPRRAFAPEPLHKAWDCGVPGLYCQPDGLTHPRDRRAWTLAVALGSDGSRAWFLVADALAPQPRIGDELRGRVMFLAGECSAVVLHRDLDKPSETASKGRREEGANPGFAGWPILKDIEGREDDDPESRRIALRFIVARLPRMLVEDDLVIPADRLEDQARRAREEIESQLEGEGSHEAELWGRILDAFQEGAFERLSGQIVELGGWAESSGHLNGAVELYQTAFGIAAATGAVATAVEAARYSGRVLRRLAKWSEAHRWYLIARGVAEAAGQQHTVAVILDGVASTYRERGNLPAARAALEEALPLAEQSGHARALGSVYHGFMTLERSAGNVELALSYGWRAARTYDARDDRMYALASLGGALAEVGDLDASEDAWSLVADMAGDHYYKLYAVDALGHVAALRGDAAAFAAYAARADAMGWMARTTAANAEILLYRGLSHVALGRPEVARDWFARAISYAEANGFSQVLFRAERALQALDAPPGPRAGSRQEKTGARYAEVRAGLRSMRRELAGAPF